MNEIANTNLVGWETFRVGELGTIVTGCTPDTLNSENYGGNIPFITPVDMAGSRWIREGVSSLSDQGAVLARTVPENSVLVSCIGILGKVGQVAQRSAHNQQINAIIPSLKIDSSFLYYIAQTLKPQMEKVAGLQVVPIVNKSQFKKLKLTIPPLLQQRCIAEFLSTIDQTIEKTEALIHKYQQIKAGLMHDLFTRGITADGKLRPPREQAPELYKEAPIGWIPKEWEIGALSRYLTGSPKNGYSPREIDEWDGCSSLGLGCLTHSGFKTLQLKSVPLNVASRSGALLQDGDFLISRANTPQLVGLCGVYRDIGSPCIYPDLMMRITPNALLRSQYLEQYLLSSEVRIRLTALAVGTSASMVKLNSKSLTNFLMAVPIREEQELILRRSRKINIYLKVLEDNLEKLQQQKLGLMHDLLTGKVMVKIH